MKYFVLTAILLTLFVYHTPANGSGSAAEIDHLAIATIMIYDGRYEKAEAELSRVDPSSEEIDTANYYTLRGVLDSKMNRSESAIINYLHAVDLTKDKTFLAPSSPKLKKKYFFSIGKSKSEKISVIEYDGEKVKKEELEKLHLYLAKEYYKIQDYANTALHLDYAGNRGSDRPALFTLRADCYWSLKQFDEAIHSINMGLIRFPENAALLKQKY